MSDSERIIPWKKEHLFYKRRIYFRNSTLNVNISFVIFYLYLTGKRLSVRPVTINNQFLFGMNKNLSCFSPFRGVGRFSHTGVGHFSTVISAIFHLVSFSFHYYYQFYNIVLDSCMCGVEFKLAFLCE